MNSQRNTQAYDLFKLIVALILLALLIILLLRFSGPGTTASQQGAAGEPAAAVQAPTLTATAAGEAAAAEEPAGGQEPAGQEAAATPTAAPLATATPLPTATLAPTATQPPPTPTPAAAADTPTPEATPTAAAEEPAPAPEQAGASGDCSAAIPSQLSVGMKARVASNLNFRSSPGIENNLIRVHPVGTQLEITGGPVCVPHGNGVYRWWEVRSPDGSTGWSSEGTLEGKFYFLVPVQ